jgi:hypothetical protein
LKGLLLVRPNLLPAVLQGLAFINGFNLGWYWPELGPQQTLYIPGQRLLLKQTQILEPVGRVMVHGMPQSAIWWLEGNAVTIQGRS